MAVGSCFHVLLDTGPLRSVHGADNRTEPQGNLSPIGADVAVPDRDSRIHPAPMLKGIANVQEI